MKSTMGALVLHGLGDLRYERAPIPRVQAGWALLHVSAVGVCGSDVPRIYEHGAYHYPLIPGHEVAGMVADIAPEETLQPGDAVVVKPLIPCRRCAFCQVGAWGQCVDYDYIGSRRDGAMAEYLLAPIANLVPLPTGLDPIEASLCEPTAVALHALSIGGISAGDTVAILGCGAIGMIMAQWARVLGADEIILVDIDTHKLRLARQMWLGETVNSCEQDAVDVVRGISKGLGADLVIEAAGVPATVNQALLMARPLGRVVIMGNPSGDVNLPATTISQVLRKELTIRGSWNSRFVSLPTDEWQVALRYLADRRIDVKPLITHRVPLERGAEAIRMMHDRREPYARVVLINE